MKHALLLSFLMVFSQAFQAQNYHFLVGTNTNTGKSQGNGPCFISATPKHVFTANYGGGSLSVFARKADGSLSDLKQKIQHIG